LPKRNYEDWVKLYPGRTTMNITDEVLHRDAVKKAIENTLDEYIDVELTEDVLDGIVETLHHIIFSDEILDMLRGMQEEHKE
jgi:hypothetical protein